MSIYGVEVFDNQQENPRVRMTYLSGEYQVSVSFGPRELMDSFKAHAPFEPRSAGSDDMAIEDIQHARRVCERLAQRLEPNPHEPYFEVGS